MRIVEGFSRIVHVFDALPAEFVEDSRGLVSVHGYGIDAFK